MSTNDTKWTPGPWNTVHNSWETSSIYGVDGLYIGTVFISDLCDEDSQPNFERIKDATANLISAAPDLYAMVQELVDELEPTIRACINLELPCRIARDMEVIERARALLAKARGEST